MKKSILIVGCIISCFILVSLSYQPIIAEDMPNIKQKEEVEMVEYEDCECDKNSYPKLLCFVIQTMIGIDFIFLYVSNIRIRC